MTNPSPGIATTIHLRFIRGTEADITAAAAASQFDVGEPVWATDTNRLYIASTPSSVVPIGPASNLPLTDYLNLKTNNIAIGNNTFEGVTSLRGETTFGVTVSSTGMVTRWPSVLPTSTASTSILPASDSSTRLATTEWVGRYIATANLPPRIAIRDQLNTFTETNTFQAQTIFNDPIAINEGGSYKGVNDFSAGTINVPTQSVNGPFDGKAASTLFVRDFVQAQVLGGYARLAQSNTFSGVTTHDFSATASLLGPTPQTSWSAVTGDDKRVATIGWIKANLPSGPNLLSTNNTWSGANTWAGDSIFNQPPVISQALSPTENSNRVPTTSWVRNLISTQMGQGNGPVVSKSPASADAIEWTTGSVLVGGTMRSIPAGSYRYLGPAGTFYVVAVQGASSVTVEANRTAVPSESNETLLATVTVVDKGLGSNPRYEVAGVTNATTNFSEYARRYENNTFTHTNTFTGEVNILLSPGGVMNGATFRRNAIGIHSSSIGLYGNVTISNGVAKGEYPIAPNDNSTILATTAWVNSRLGDASSYFTQDSNGNLVLKPGLPGSIDLRPKPVYAAHPPAPTTSDNQLATTKWVQELLSGTSSSPLIGQGPGLSIVWTSGTVMLPPGVQCSGPNCYLYTPGSQETPEDEDCPFTVTPPPSQSGYYCQINCSKCPMPITPDTKYVFVRFTDCAMVASSVAPTGDQGIVIADIRVEGDVVICTPRSTTGWATINSPNFSGRPTAPMPPLDVCDDQIATTEWVCNKVEDALHKPCEGMNLPRVYQVDNTFQVNITSGQVPKPIGLGGGSISVSPLNAPVSVVIGQTEFHWIRYRDGKFVVSSQRPNQDTEGYLLATSRTTSNEVQITMVPEAVQQTALTLNYVVGFGGNLIYVGPVEC